MTIAVGVCVLLVEDDPRIVSFLKPGLEAEGYSVEVARDGPTGLRLALAGGGHIILLDRMLPGGMDGVQVCAALRAAGRRSLVLMLTAKDELQDKIDGLKSGADDYLTKPFAFDELLARMEALLRRGQPGSDAATALQIGDLRLDLATKMVHRGERRVGLTVKEFTLLSYLMKNAGSVVSRQKLLANVWGLSFDPGTKVVDVYIRYLRRKVDDGEDRPMIKTVRGFGYTLSADPA